MQADTLAALLTQLDMAPAVIAGGSGGFTFSMLTAAQHRAVASGLALWWISGGGFGLMSLGVHYCGQSLVNAWQGSMDDVVALPVGEEVLERNPSNRQRFLDQDHDEFVRDDGTLDARVLPVRRRVGPRSPERRGPRPRPPRVGVPQR